MQNYWNLYLACRQHQVYAPVNYRDFRETGRWSGYHKNRVVMNEVKWKREKHLYSAFLHYYINIMITVSSDVSVQGRHWLRLSSIYKLSYLRVSSPGSSGGGAGKGRRACNYVSGRCIPPPIHLWLAVNWAVRFPPISAKRKRGRM